MHITFCDIYMLYVKYICIYNLDKWISGLGPVSWFTTPKTLGICKVISFCMLMSCLGVPGQSLNVGCCQKNPPCD